ncbi:hypothetical protein WAC87_002484 [Shigella flexneri]
MLPVMPSCSATPAPALAGLQGDFELHLTIRLLNADEIAAFCHSCRQLSCKPLIIALPQGVYLTQPMASVRYSGRYDEAWALAFQLQTQFTERGFTLARIKIEVMPDSLSVPVLLTSEGGDAPYFEWHGKVDYRNTDALLAICRQHKAHLSQNSLKDEVHRRFISIRDASSESHIHKRVALLKQTLISGGWPLYKQQLELCLLDTTPSIDNGWLPQ